MIDTHCHLNDKRLAGRADELMRLARESGVTGVLVAGYDEPSCRTAGELSGLDGVYVALGIHPHEAESFAGREGWIDWIRDQTLANPKAVALGEMGLDYHYEFSSKKAQIEVFRRQIALANEMRLPITIHSREAEDEVMDILIEEGIPEAGAALHAFTGTSAQAVRAVETGLYIGVTGMITFKKADALRKAVKQVPICRILLETDAPYLAPVPFRGKDNHPALLPFVATALSTLLGISEQEVIRQTTSNAERFFNSFFP